MLHWAVKATPGDQVTSDTAAAPFTGELSVIADQPVPYRLLMEVLYTAGQAELGN